MRISCSSPRSGRCFLRFESLDFATVAAGAGFKCERKAYKREGENKRRHSVSSRSQSWKKVNWGGGCGVQGGAERGNLTSKGC